MAKAEKVQIENVTLNDIFKEEFIKKVSKLGKSIFPITVVFINEFERDGKKQAYPLVLSHQSSKEVETKILHIESPDTDLLDSFVKFLEKK